MGTSLGLAKAAQPWISSRAIAFAGALLLAGPWGSARAEQMPRLSEILKPLPPPHRPTVLLDEGGTRVGEIHGPRHCHTVLLQDIPLALRWALVDTEDPRFFENSGFDPRGIGRALLHDLWARKAKEGASTLTQQLARTLLNDRSKTLSRKVKEAWLTMQLEHEYTKDAILMLYLNEVYWGHGAYGVQAASEVYFNRPVGQLGLGQMALFVSLLRGPGVYDPLSDKHVWAAAKRRAYVLDRMVAAGHITRAQAESAGQAKAISRLAQRLAAGQLTPRAAAVRLRSYLGVVPIVATGNWFTDTVAAELALRHGRATVEEGSLTVTVTMDTRMQAAAEAAAQLGLARDGRRFGFSQVALVAQEPSSGKIRAMVGGLGKTEYNRAMARLQTGSAFKPIVYLAAFARGRNPQEMVLDAPAHYLAGAGRWYTPHNDDGRYRGSVSLRTALEQSINSVAVALLASMGIGPVADLCRDLGISSPLNLDLTLALGSSAITPVELCAAYAAFANDGVWVQPTIYTQVSNSGGAVIDRPVPQRRRVAEVGPVRSLVDVLGGVLARGTAAGQGIWRPAAGKTGTSSEFRDAWFVGFTPSLCAAVWVGNDDRHPMRRGAFGGRVAARIWHDFMIRALKGRPVQGFPKAPAPTFSPASPAQTDKTVVPPLAPLGNLAPTVSPAPPNRPLPLAPQAPNLRVLPPAPPASPDQVRPRP